MNENTPQPPSVQIAHIADELRALSDNGQHYTDDPYQIERFTRIRTLAAELQSLADTRPPEEIRAIFSADLDTKTPLAVVDTAVLDPSGRLLLIQRADDRLWAMPGGACDVGETPAAAGAREVWEETGYTVEITRLLGVFDSRHSGTVSSRHLYHFLFAADELPVEPEEPAETLPELTPPEDEQAFRILKLDDGLWQVEGVAIERAALMTKWDYYEAAMRFQRILDAMGISQALRDAGVTEGDAVRIADVELVWGYDNAFGE
jgi:Obg family GTPase CgtA-like protein